MRYLIQRMVHNDNGWTAPSPGRLKYTGDGDYLEDHGFAHEDWNFTLDKSVDGHVHGYMYFVPKDPKGPFNVLFATYDKGEGWALCGYYQNASFDERGATYTSRVLRRRAEELQELKSSGSLGGAYRRKSISQIATRLKSDAQYYRWRVLPRNIHRLQKPLRLPQSQTSRFGAYFTRPTELQKSEWDKLLAFAADFTDKDPEDNYSDGGDIEFPEGRKYEVKHKARERNRRLVAAAKKAFVATHGRLFCEACKFDFQTTYGNAGCGFIEVHHKIPVSQLKAGAKTRIADMAIVCSNCHRILHRRRPWLTITALQNLLKNASR